MSDTLVESLSAKSETEPQIFMAEIQSSLVPLVRTSGRKESFREDGSRSRRGLHRGAVVAAARRPRERRHRPRASGRSGAMSAQIQGLGGAVGTIRSSIFNLTNTILGSGTLAADACKLCGWGFVALIILTALLADYAIRVLFLAVEKRRAAPSAVDGARCPWWGTALLLGGDAAADRRMHRVRCHHWRCSAYRRAHRLGDRVCARWPLQLFLLAFIIFPLCLLPSMTT